MLSMNLWRSTHAFNLLLFPLYLLRNRFLSGIVFVDEEFLELTVLKLFGEIDKDMLAVLVIFQLVFYLLRHFLVKIKAKFGK